MNTREYLSEVSARLALRTSVLWAFAASLLTNVILALSVAFAENNERTIVLPAQPSKSFWVDSHTVSPEYLEEMSLFTLQLALNNSPETFDYNLKKLLSYVTPEERGATELALTAEGRRLKSANASISFLPESVEVKASKLEASVKGSVRQFIGNSLTSVTRKCWVVTFAYEGSRLWVKRVLEAECKKPFEPLPSDKERVL